MNDIISLLLSAYIGACYGFAFKGIQNIAVIYPETSKEHYKFFLMIWFFSPISVPILFVLYLLEVKE